MTIDGAELYGAWPPYSKQTRDVLKTVARSKFYERRPTDDIPNQEFEEYIYQLEMMRIDNEN